MPLLSPHQVGPLPAGARLLHIGPHKTGTTALQGAFDANRLALARQGVHYAGRGLQPSAPVTALRGARPLHGERPGSESAWEDLAREVRRAGDRRVAISSEYFSDLDDELATRVVRDLGSDDLHVLVTVRPLTRLAPSQWQQYVQNRQTVGYERWLDLMLRHPPYERPSPSFWRRHRHDRLALRWARIVGADRVTVLVVDDDDRGMLPRTVERLLDLGTGTLTPPPSRSNRGLTQPEIEVVRRLNRIARAEAWSDGDYAHVVRNGVVRSLKQRAPDPGDSATTSPPWADELLAGTGREIAANLSASDLRVVGDLRRLAGTRGERPRGSTFLELGRAADVVAGAALSVVPGPLPERPLPDVDGRTLLGTLLGRSGDRARHELRVRTARWRSRGSS